MSGADPVAARAGTAPESPALIHGDGMWSYGELDRRVDEAARRMRGGAAGPQPGRAGRVSLLLSGGGEAVVLLHAAARAGLEAAPLSPRLTEPELRAALEALEPALVVVGSGSEARVRAALGGAAWERGTPRVVPVDALPDLPVHRGPLDPLPPERVRAVLWTSGTTGSPRGVLLTGANLAASARAAARRLDLGPGDRWHASLSVAHVGGLALVTRAAHLGSVVVARDGFDAADFVAGARRGSVSHASLVPVMLRRVLEVLDGEPAPEALRCVLLGGARTPPSLLERALEAGVPVALTYGQTEASSQIATAPPARVREKPGTVGAPLPGVELRIAADPTGDDGAEAAGDGQGEILVRGPTVAAGYLGGEPLPMDPDGWLRTGDRGRLDADGDLWITGRLAERIVTGGVTVDPAEVEEALRGLPGVADAAVVGVPDPEWGEAVAAALVPAAGSAPDEDAVRSACRARLSGPKRPRRLRFLDALPRNATGKVDRGAVRRLLADA